MEKVARIHRTKAANGARYDVREIQEYIDVSTKDGADWIQGLRRLELEDGTRVNYLDDDTFEIVPTQRRLFRI